jgi:hypothetical protein
MNLRDLWDNVVLRDILGYIVPGLVTLFAIALPVAYIARTSLLEIVVQMARSAGLGFLEGEHWLAWRPWLLWATLLPLAFVLGHLQAWGASFLEAKVRCWNHGRLSLRFLRDSGAMGYEYCKAAHREMPVEDFRRLCELLQPTGSGSESPDDDPKRSERTAADLWRLCDRFVLVKNPNLHGMFMGRYYVLLVLFLNLGISSILLAICLLASKWCVAPMPALIGGLACATFGVLMLARSTYFRKRFIECTFPIFYAIVQAEERSKAAQA